jgi:hypothetical protein
VNILTVDLPEKEGANEIEVASFTIPLFTDGE